MDILTENFIKLGLAILVGGVIGAEREFQDKAAGFRTIILITVGAALFTIFSISLDPGNSRTRIAANIVTGIGFLGAGTIIREGGRIAGLTTAATIWLSSALGMGIGAGEIPFVLGATVAVLIVLLVFPYFEGVIDHFREARTYRVVIRSTSAEKATEADKLMRSTKLQVLEYHLAKTDNATVSTWRTIGSPKKHEQFVKAMIADPEVHELDY
ncbi:MAG: MgtC/SapB family protein [Chloroflexi bacterium]|nr:MgtC/SapB family protein [Chloroflexota bacterium]